MLLLSYFDKIGLTLTGEAGQASAYLYSEARLYKGARLAPVSQSTTIRLQAISPWGKRQSATATHVEQ